jgi:hypothetical protein
MERNYIYLPYGRRPTNPHWARVVGYGQFSLWVIHKEGLCPSSGDINRLMTMMMIMGDQRDAYVYYVLTVAQV